MTSSTGTVEFSIGTKTFYTWYRVLGDLKTGQRPLVALHGGPGLTHDYLLSHEKLVKQIGIPVVLYDQVGNGNSSHVKDVPSDFWTPDLFMDELDNLLNRLGIIADFDLLGHSWGGMLAGTYASSRRPVGLKRLIIADTPASIELCMVSHNALLDGFGEEFAAMMRKHEEEDTVTVDEYTNGLKVFNNRHICSIQPWPEQLLASLKSGSVNPTVSVAMAGKYTFKVEGTMKNWSIVDKLPNILVPVLLVSGVDDTMQPVSMWPWFTRVPRIKWVEFQNSSHLPMFEEPDRYFEVLSKFLTETE